MEPRLVERRRTVREARHRSRRRRLIGLGIVVAVLAGGIGSAFSPVLDVDRVRVTGTDRDAADVMDAGGLRPGEPMVTVDAAGARRRLTSLPWVAGAAVERRWPSTVVVHVEPEVPVALVESPSGTTVVARSGRVLGEPGSAVAGGSVEGLPTVVVGRATTTAAGAEVDDDVQRSVLLVGRLPATVAEQVERVELDPSGDLSLALTDGATVLMGPLTDEPAKLLALRTVLDRVARECMATLDVRVPTRVVVSRRADCEPPPPSTTADEPTAEESDGAGPAEGDATDTGGATAAAAGGVGAAEVALNDGADR